MRLSWLCKWRSNVKSLFVLYISNHWAYRSQILYAYEYQGSSLIFLHPLMAYHLTCQHVKFSSSLFFFLSSISCGQHFANFSSSNQHEIFHDHLVCHEVVSYTIVFEITHAWRHVGAILWFSDLVTWSAISSKLNMIFEQNFTDINFRSRSNIWRNFE